MAIVTADLPAPTTGDVLFEIGRGLRAAHDGDDPAAVYMLVAPLVQSFVVGVVEAAKREALTEAADELITWGSRTSVKDWLRARAGVGAVPQTTEEPECEHGRTGPHESAFRINGVMWRCPGPVGAPLVGEGPTDA